MSKRLYAVEVWNSRNIEEMPISEQCHIATCILAMNTEASEITVGIATPPVRV